MLNEIVENFSFHHAIVEDNYLQTLDEIALLALWLAEHQMNMAFLDKFGHYEPTLPLKASGNIVLGLIGAEIFPHHFLGYRLSVLQVLLNHDGGHQATIYQIPLPYITDTVPIFYHMGHQSRASILYDSGVFQVSWH